MIEGAFLVAVQILPFRKATFRPFNVHVTRKLAKTGSMKNR